MDWRQSILGDIPHERTKWFLQITENSLSLKMGQLLSWETWTASPKSASIFNRENNLWELDQEIYSKLYVNNVYRSKIDISKNNEILAISNIDSSEVFIYSNENNSWEEIANISNVSGDSVSLSSNGEVIAIGDTDYYNSSVKVYTIDNFGEWNKVGNDILGEKIGEYFGSTIELSNDGSLLAVGSLGKDGVTTGSTRIYKNINSV